MDESFNRLLVSFFLGGLISLATITNPLSKIPVFLTLAADLEAGTASQEARRACFYGFLLLTGGLFAGVFILEAFGISFGALRIAGGLTVALIGYRMLFGTTDTALVGGSGSFAFFPLAMPGIAGPGALATVIGISSEIAELAGGMRRLLAYVATVAAIAATCLIIWLVLRSARWVSRRLGSEGINVVARLTGFLLICIGVQFVGSGIRSFMAGA
ncbi:MarC family NAAT transporter [Dechloromonas hortensis]|uniref:MarC family NAAT transporter n=1 Tax=Dechloromonas hortensis TaxID=337779 RepID=UPI0012918A42|nr:MarC family NAAT transporter [Dechloromonas hortensis]